MVKHNAGFVFFVFGWPSLKRSEQILLPSFGVNSDLPVDIRLVQVFLFSLFATWESIKRKLLDMLFHNESSLVSVIIIAGHKAISIFSKHFYKS